MIPREGPSRGIAVYCDRSARGMFRQRPKRQVRAGASQGVRLSGAGVGRDPQRDPILAAGNQGLPMQRGSSAGK